MWLLLECDAYLNIDLSSSVPKQRDKDSLIVDILQKQYYRRMTEI
jgi:hypothetical protein